jgi:biotin operon repressor
VTLLDYLAAHPTPVKYRVLSEATGMSRREVELEIRRLRLEHYPILTDSDGAVLSRDPVAIRACAQRLRSRAAHQFETAAALEKAADRLPMDLWTAA